MAITLEIKSRENKKVRELRKVGIIPATMYGPEIGAINIQLDEKSFSKVPFEDHTHLINLQEGTNTHEVLIKNIQRDFLSRRVLNIEFYKVMKGHKLNAKVAFKFIGESKAVKLGADFVVNHKEAHIRCLPRHIPYSIEVDITVLENPEDQIAFEDLKLSDEIELLDPELEIICKAVLAKKDHTIEPVATEAAPAPDAVPTAGAEKKEEAKS